MDLHRSKVDSCGEPKWLNIKLFEAQFDQWKQVDQESDERPLTYWASGTFKFLSVLGQTNWYISNKTLVYNSYCLCATELCTSCDGRYQILLVLVVAVNIQHKYQYCSNDFSLRRVPLVFSSTLRKLYVSLSRFCAKGTHMKQTVTWSQARCK